MKQLIYLIFFFSSIAFSQQYNFKQYGLEQGLAQSQVYAIDQDDKGFLWIGTQGGGVNVFDGREFQYINRHHGLNNLYINKIKFHNTRTSIWVGSDNGLFLFSREKKLLQSFLENHEVTDLFIHENICYVGTNKGAYKITKDNQVIELTKGKIQSLFLSKNRLFIATNQQINIYENEKLIDTIPLQLTRSFYEMNRELFVCTYAQGTFKIEDNELTPQPQLPTPYGLITAFSQNTTTTWLTTVSDGVFCIKDNEITQHFNTQKGLPSNSIRSVFTDNRGALWIGTSGRGICQFINDDIYSINTKEVGVHSIFKAENTLFLSTFSGGLDSISLTKTQTYSEKGKTNFTKKKVRCITVIDSNNSWISTDGDGLFTYDNKSFARLFKNNNKLKWVRAIVPDQSGTVWLGTLGYGLCYFDGTEIHQLNKHLFDRVNDLTLIHQNQLAVATNKGLFIMDLTSKTFAPSLYTDACRSVTVCNNKLFVGTKNDGVFHIKDNKRYKLKNTWSDNTYFVRTGSDNNLWIGSEQGVQKFHFTEFPHAEIVNIGKERGLIGIETCVNAFANDSMLGGVWVGTLKGASFIKNTITNTQDSLLPQLTITEMDVFYDPIPNFRELSVKGLRFFHHQNHISFRVLGVDLQHATAIKYKWKLDGYDKSWSSPNSNNYITYSNLPFGNYHFLVQASLDGIHWTKEEQVDFSIMRPFWRTYWFYTASGIVIFLFIVLAIFLAYKGYRWKIAQHQQNLRIQNRLKELELNTLRLQLNPHFLFNCLNSIKGYIAENQGKEARKQITNFAKLMRQYLDNSSAQWITISQEIKMLTNYLNLEVMLNNDQISFELLTEKEDLKIPPMIIQPFVENAIHHGLKPLGKAGKVSIHFYLEQNELFCTITDNGVGRKKAGELSEKKEHESKALSIIKERLSYLSQENEHDYHFEFTDLQQGTSVKVSLPYQS